MHDHGLIETPEALQAFLDSIAGTDWIALDTEFLREKTYYPQLCLVQAATLDQLACIDPLRLDIQQLAPLFRDPGITKVFHAASQDMELLYRELGFVPSPVFDTQIAASMLGYGEQVGYANLVKTVLERDLDKSQTRTDWSRRPLSAEQIRYAADDVRHLATLFNRLLHELDTHDRMHWLRPEMEALSNPALYEPDPEQSWQRVSGVKRLKPKERGVLKCVAAWRERTAQSSNRPRRWVLSDDLLLDIARRTPADAQGLRELRQFPGGMKPEHTESLLAAIREGQALPREQWPQLPEKPRLDERDEVLVDIGMALLRECAREHQISAAAIAQRKDVIELLKSDGKSGRLSSGWRREIAGQTIQHWFSGESRLACKPSGELDMEPVSETIAASP
ncbi:ribonuclease D [Thioalkalivibrio sp. K90mix]|jgi:ribonuclease D|uniref:ribonuclease D n=1 Tax=Thioalkalivibrio sp. (strain K90mix) TaxID=396595 RepID=UPI000195A95A|nr:ribonuclease D [Thioalkalivibrio sp. K90mix]ADC70841.1 ribonuclease D [Thioalkalivibrio sp. K90mix]